MKPITNIDDPRYVKALSHPLRVRILAMLQERGVLAPLFHSAAARRWTAGNFPGDRRFMPGQ